MTVIDVISRDVCGSFRLLGEVVKILSFVSIEDICSVISRFLDFLKKDSKCVPEDGYFYNILEERMDYDESCYLLSPDEIVVLYYAGKILNYFKEKKISINVLKYNKKIVDIFEDNRDKILDKFNVDVFSIDFLEPIFVLAYVMLKNNGDYGKVDSFIEMFLLDKNKGGKHKKE